MDKVHYEMRSKEQVSKQSKPGTLSGWWWWKSLETLYASSLPHAWGVDRFFQCNFHFLPSEHLWPFYEQKGQVRDICSCCFWDLCLMSSHQNFFDAANFLTSQCHFEKPRKLCQSPHCRDIQYLWRMCHFMQVASPERLGHFYQGKKWQTSRSHVHFSMNKCACQRKGRAAQPHDQLLPMQWGGGYHTDDDDQNMTTFGRPTRGAHKGMVPCSSLARQWSRDKPHRISSTWNTPSGGVFVTPLLSPPMNVRRTHLKWGPADPPKEGHLSPSRFAMLAIMKTTTSQQVCWVSVKANRPPPTITWSRDKNSPLVSLWADLPIPTTTHHKKAHAATLGLRG